MFKKKKLRRFLAGATTTAVVGGMLALGSPAAATSTRTDNPSVIGCGLPITLVLDASGSIEQGAERDAVKAASIAFLNGLADTSSSARIIQFSTTSEQLSPRLPIAGTDLTALKDAINTKYYTGVGGNMTNWQMPLWQTSTETPTPLADGLVVFVTDGDPNTIGGFEGKAISYPAEDSAADAAMVYANTLKTAGNRVIAVGVGVSGSASQARLTKISGDVIKTSIAPTDTINSFDVLIPANFDNLASALKTVAAALCGGSITVTKYTDPGGQWTTTAGVQIAATVSGATYGQDYLWSQPVGTTTSTAVTNTDSNGVAQMQYNPASSWPGLTPLPTVRVTESLASGYSPRDYTCTFNGLTSRANQHGQLTVSGDEAYFEVAALSADQSMSCDIYNRGHGWLTLAKDVRGKGDPAAWTLSAIPVGTIDGQQPVTGNGDPTSNGGVQEEQVYAGTYQLAEEGGLDNYTSLGWTCESDEPGQNSLAVTEPADTVTIAAGESWTCTVTNVRDTASLTLIKTVSGSSVKADAFTLSATAEAPDAELNFSTAGGAGTVHEVWASTPYALSETGPSGYTPGDWLCTAAPRDEAVPVQQGKVTLKKGQKVTCSLVNTRDTSSLTISKEFNPLASGYSGTFDIAYSCVEGTDPVKSGTVKLAAGQQASVEGLPVGTVCTVTEPALPTNPSGWTFNAPTFSPGDGKATIVKSSAATVTVVNSISQVSPVKVKQPCPVTPKLVTPKPKVVGNQVLITKMSTNSKCTMSKPVVLCRPMVATAAGETAFCKTSVSKKGKVMVKTAGYDAVRVTVMVKATPKPGSVDSWTPKVWRQKWTLR